MRPRLFAQGHRELMAQHQDLGVLPPRLPSRQAQRRHGPGDDEEDQLQAHKPKIIARQPQPDRPSGTVHVTQPTASGKASAQVAQVFGTHRHGTGRIVRKTARRAGITKTVTPYTLRHAFITAALDAGVPLRDMQEAASHADPRTTMRYDNSWELHQMGELNASFLVLAA